MLATMKNTPSRAGWRARALVVLSAVAVLWLPAIYLSNTTGALAEDAKLTVAKEPANEFLPPLTESEERILAKLQERTDMDFHETPLQDAVEYLQDLHNFHIRLDTKALEEVGTGPDTPLKYSVDDVKLESGLRMLLRPKDLTYVVRDEVLLITSKDVAEHELITRTYPLGDLLGDADPPDFDTLIEAITGTVLPDSWDEVGGPGSLQEVPVAKSLVISQTRDAHDEVLELLRSLRAARQTSAGGPASRR